MEAVCKRALLAALQVLGASSAAGPLGAQQPVPVVIRWEAHGPESGHWTYAFRNGQVLMDGPPLDQLGNRLLVVSSVRVDLWTPTGEGRWSFYVGVPEADQHFEISQAFRSDNHGGHSVLGLASVHLGFDPGLVFPTRATFGAPCISPTTNRIERVEVVAEYRSGRPNEFRHPPPLVPPSP